MKNRLSPTTKNWKLKHKIQEPKHAPFKIPIIRRRQTFSVFLMSSTIILLPTLYFLLWSIPIARNIIWPVLIYYTVFYYILDKSHLNGNAFNRYSEYMKSLPLFSWFSEYFPIEIHKTVDLKPTFTEVKISSEVYKFKLFNYLPNSINKIIFNIVPDFIKEKKNIQLKEYKRTGPRYIFCYHPHGIISCGLLGAVIPINKENPNSFNNLFPGIKVFILTIVNQFSLPFYRDFLMSLGVSSVGKRSIKSLILKFNASVCIVIGGASESLLAKPGANSLVLKKRKGFIKIALECAGLSPNDNSTLDDPNSESNKAISKNLEKLSIESNISTPFGSYTSFEPLNSSLLKSQGKSFNNNNDSKIPSSSTESSVDSSEAFQIVDFPNHQNSSSSNNSSSTNISNQQHNNTTTSPLLVDDGDCDLYMVPVYGFGENNLFDVYDTKPNKLANTNSVLGNLVFKLRNNLKRLQIYIKNKLGFTIPFFFARGVFNYDFGFLPYRRKVHVVVGEPIPVKRQFGNSPGDEVKSDELDYYHGVYVESLIKLFDENKQKYLSPNDGHLVIEE